MSVGLRERKKLRTRAAIRREAMRLFMEKGFQTTTVDEIAAAAEIAPSTFFVYFPRKEDVVLQDDLDPAIIQAFNAQPPELGPIVALHNALRAAVGELPPDEGGLQQQRMALITSDSTLRAALVNDLVGMMDEVAVVMAERAHRSPGDFEVRTLAGVVLGVFLAAILAAPHDPQHNLMQLVDMGLTHLEAGLPLE